MRRLKSLSSFILHCIIVFVLFFLAANQVDIGHTEPQGSPTPLLKKGHPVDWWFVFKLNSKAFPGCGNSVQRSCPFGGTVQDYRFGQQYVFASSENPKIEKGDGCTGQGLNDPLGATFDEVYNGSFYYVVWNDQFYDDPKIRGCGKSCGSPWGHSKGMLAWNDLGEGFVLQVTTPSWPASGNNLNPRKTDGNTLGCVKDNDVLVSQHFFSLKLTKEDLMKVLKGLKNASVVTDPSNPQLVNNVGPEEVKSLVSSLGIKSKSDSVMKEVLSTGVEFVSKPSALHVPPWQMVSALLGGISLRTATWWANPQIYSTSAASKISCWDDSLGKSGPVEIATSGEWDGTAFGLKGGPGGDFNHAKIGVSFSEKFHYAIFGDLNQQGTASGKNCASSQNGRGGLFYIINNEELSLSVAALIRGNTAPAKAPRK
jgi:hypothetical protein